MNEDTAMFSVLLYVHVGPMLIPFKLVYWFICRFTTQQRASNCLYTSKELKMIHVSSLPTHTLQ